MRLFISNFKNIGKVAGIFLILFGLYNGLLLIFKPHITAYQNQWQGNMAFAQEYVYFAPPPA